MRKLKRLSLECDLKAGGTVPLNDDQRRYLTSVLRLESGNGILVFNGRDGLWRATLETTKKAASLIIEVQESPQTVPEPLTLIFTPLKPTPLAFLIEKATELGVTALHPILTERTTTRDLNVRRAHALMQEAAEQSERLTLPTLHPLVPLADYLKAHPHTTPLHVCDERGAETPLMKEAAAVSHILLGPEGGFSATEFSLLAYYTFVKNVSLGHTILRAETAALAALAVVQNARLVRNMP